MGMETGMEIGMRTRMAGNGHRAGTWMGTGKTDLGTGQRRRERSEPRSARRAAVGAGGAGRAVRAPRGSTCAAPVPGSRSGAERQAAAGPERPRGRYRVFPRGAVTGTPRPENAAAPSLGTGLAAGTSGSVGA